MTAKWNSDNRAPVGEALWTEQVRGWDGVVGLGQVRHPGYAWTTTVAQATAIDHALQQAAGHYLVELAKQVPELVAVSTSLHQADGPLSWLPVGWGLDGSDPVGADPNASFLLTRGDAAAWREASLVLLAARRWQGKAVGDAVGLRVTAGVTRANVGGPWRLRFSSLNCSRLHLACTPATVDSRVFDRGIQDQLHRSLDASQLRIRAVHGTADADICTLHGVALRAPGPKRGAAVRGRVWAFAVQLNLRTQAMQTLRCRPWASAMQALRLFERDPASMGDAASLEQRRPGLDGARLDKLREFHDLAPPYPPYGQMGIADTGARFVVAREGRASAKPLGGGVHLVGPMRRTKPPTVRAGGRDPFDYLPLRSDALADAQAHLRGKALFDRFDAYGFDVQQYFRHAALPLTIWPRARLRGAADGHIVNAEVFPVALDAKTGFEWPLGSQAPSAHPLDPGQRPHLQMALGSADISSRRGNETLGLAADPRWIWHEFCHVLNFAATGELEFAFAHSAGDALAAISADPDSCLAADTAMRGNTFPWAYAPRRHDRLAVQGFGWCGARNALRLDPTPPANHYQHGYFEEQLLSSSLFRLYRCLGGDTGVLPVAEALTQAQRDDLACRRSASDYCVYLVMRAIALLGSNTVTPARSVDQFVTALIDADLGTAEWRIEVPWPYRDHQTRELRRLGGRVHKVIRWAFEQQGLYATDDPEAVVEGLGLAPQVDVYIADRRGSPDIAPGGYVPIPLRWDPQAQAPWNASADAMTCDAAGRITVKLGQCGQRRTDELSLRLWACTDLTPGSTATWQALSAQRDQGGDSFSADLVGSATSASRPLWLLACVDAPADPSNLAAGAKPPVDQAKLVELVAHDNNLALGLLRSPGYAA